MSKDNNQKEQLQAAYALNLCSVSISQIIEYQDLHIMEQEYEAILNNLNLENMPKDEALLNILTQILNVITFFRIQDEDKKLVERQYEQKMKNAIWKAIPNPSVFVMGNISKESIGKSVIKSALHVGTSSMVPLAMGLSLAYSVGTGYMNYRNAKAESKLALDKEEWELQRAAIEQLNGLRRELFTTAWRLAEKYEFPDRYRLTENQIKHYNEILMDPDPVRRFERLEYIKDDFEAYPVFWYHLGHAANAIVWDMLGKLNISDKQKTADEIEYTSEQKAIISGADPYVEIAKVCFNKYFTKNDSALLRTDEIVATCALEYIDLLDPREPEQYEKICEYLTIAVESVGDKLDVLQLCAFKYIQIGLWDEAIPILRHLVSEDYNKKLNAQVLSAAYVRDYIENSSAKALIDFKLLSDRVDAGYLFNIEADSFEAASAEFISSQGLLLQARFNKTLTELHRKYEIRFNKILPSPAVKERNDDYYLDENREIRRQDATKLVRFREFSNRLLQSEVMERYADLANDVYDALSSVVFVEPENLTDAFENSIKDDDVRDKIQKMAEIMKKEEISVEDYNTLTELSMDDILREMFIAAKEDFSSRTQQLSKMSDIAQIESSISEFCVREGIVETESLDEDLRPSNSMMSYERFSLLGDLTEAGKVDESRRQIEDMQRLIQENIAGFVLSPDNMQLFTRRMLEFDTYIQDTKGKTLGSIRKNIVAILDDSSVYDFDLVFTTTGIIPVRKGSPKSEETYDEIKRTDKGISIGMTKYDHKDVNFDVLMEVIGRLSKIATQKEKVDIGKVMIGAGSAALNTSAAAAGAVGSVLKKLAGRKKGGEDIDENEKRGISKENIDEISDEKDEN